ncbi:MAG: Ig-like domain-containing protein [Christensenellales bacterium]|jgi:hypothetical protein
MKNRKIFSIVSLFLLLSVVSCQHGSSQSQDSTSIAAPTIVIEEVGQTAIYVGDELQLTATVTNNIDNLTLKWKSSNEEIATVSDAGLVRALAPGNVNICAYLQGTEITSNIIALGVLMPIPMTGVEITNVIDQYFLIDQTLDITVALTPNNARNDLELIAEPSAKAEINGMCVKFLDEGNITLTVRSRANNEVQAQVMVQVLEKSPFLQMSKGYSLNMSFQNMLKLENAYIDVKDYSDENENPFHQAIANITATRFYFETRINLQNYRGGEHGWPYVGVGHATEVSNYREGRALFFSPMDEHKVVTMDLGKCFAAEGSPQDQFSLSYQANGLKDMDITALKLAVLRDENEFYFLINDVLYGYEVRDYTSIPTNPIIYGKDTYHKMSDWYMTTDADVINAKLQGQNYKNIFFPGRDNTVVDNENKTITFSCKDGNKWEDSYAVATYAKTIGDKALLEGDFEIEYDITAIHATTNEIAKRLSLMLLRADTYPHLYDCFGVNNWWWEDNNEVYGAEYKTWSEGQPAYSSANVVNGRIGDDGVRQKPAEPNDHVVGHYKVTRVIEGGKSVFTWTFTQAGTDKTENVFAFTGKENVKVSYTGRYRINFGAACVDGTIANWTWKNIE